jgi:hypothetical protein
MKEFEELKRKEKLLEYDHQTDLIQEFKKE